MKRFFLIIILCLALLGLTGCEGEADTGDGRLRVVTTIFPPYDFTRQIAGDAIELTMLLSPETESHSFEPTLQDIAVIQDCDLFICIGGASEGWVEDVLAKVDTSGITVLRLMDCIEPIVTADSGHHGHDETCHHEADECDEHIWTSPRNAVLMTQAICKALCECDPDNAGDFLAGAQEYEENLLGLDGELTEICESAARHTLVFAERFPFAYLARDYGLEHHAAFAGCSSDTEPSLAAIAQLTALVEEEGIPAVFYIEFSDQTCADTICAATGAKKLMLHSCHNLTQEEFDAGATYLGLMASNLENLREALN